MCSLVKRILYKFAPSSLFHALLFSALVKLPRFAVKRDLLLCASLADFKAAVCIIDTRFCASLSLLVG